VQETAARLGIPVETIDEWGEQGLLTFQDRPASSSGLERAERQVEEEQLHEVAECLGWLRLAADQWEGPEDP